MDFLTDMRLARLFFRCCYDVEKEALLSDSHSSINSVHGLSTLMRDDGAGSVADDNEAFNDCCSTNNLISGLSTAGLCDDFLSYRPACSSDSFVQSGTLVMSHSRSVLITITALLYAL